MVDEQHYITVPVLEGLVPSERCRSAVREIRTSLLRAQEYQFSFDEYRTYPREGHERENRDA